jgi:2-polyprenyl-3-methyl-5-hydroxy-6-metoxy-1,4-benzoquinol methylase
MAKICIACSSKDNLKLFKEKSFLDYPIYICSSCGLSFYYGDDPEIEKKCDEYYNSGYWNTVRKKWDNKRKKIIPIIKIMRNLGTKPLQQMWHYRAIQHHSGKKGKLLDIGCGKGEFMDFFYSMGYDVNGIEPDKRNAESINKKFKKEICINSIAEKAKLKDKYDVIYLCHVFEHLIRPDIFLRSIKKYISKNGHIFIEVPNCENPAILENSIRYHPHIYNFTDKSLNRLFESCGYEILESGPYSEKTKNNMLKLPKMLLRLNNYKKAKGREGEMLIMLASPKIQ